MKDVQGLSLRNVRASLYHAGKKEQDFFGEMLFTHFGVTGPIILQAAVPVMEGDTEETLAARVLEQEHRIFPKAIRLYAEGRLQTVGRTVHILPADEGGAS